jgi:hypothetical protein
LNQLFHGSTLPMKSCSVFPGARWHGWRKEVNQGARDAAQSFRRTHERDVLVHATSPERGKLEPFLRLHQLHASEIGNEDQIYLCVSDKYLCAGQVTEIFGTDVEQQVAGTPVPRRQRQRGELRKVGRATLTMPVTEENRK